MIQITLPGSLEEVNGIGVGKPIAEKMEPGQVKIEISLSTEETHAPQPTIQSNSVNDHSESFIPSEERTWNDMLVNENFKGHTLESRISNLGVKLVRHHDQEERNWWCCSLEIDRSKTAERISENTFPDSAWFEHVFKREQKKQVPTLQDFPRRCDVFSRYSRTHWRERDRA